MMEGSGKATKRRGNWSCISHSREGKEHLEKGLPHEWELTTYSFPPTSRKRRPEDAPEGEGRSFSSLRRRGKSRENSSRGSSAWFGWSQKATPHRKKKEEYVL